jgi:hypothetical protein
VPYSSSSAPRRATPSRAVLTYGSTRVRKSSSPMPPAHLRLVVRRRFRLALAPAHELHERVGAEHALVRRERLGGAHRHVRLVHAGFAPDPLLAGPRSARLEYCSGSSPGSSILHVRDQHALVVARLLLRLHDDEAASGQNSPFAAVLIARDDRRPVVARVLCRLAVVVQPMILLSSSVVFEHCRSLQILHTCTTHDAICEVHMLRLSQFLGDSSAPHSHPRLSRAFFEAPASLNPSPAFLNPPRPLLTPYGMSLFLTGCLAPSRPV